MAKPELKNLEQVLLKVPEKDRDAVRKEIEELFSDYDPANPPGRPVLLLAPDTVVCPACGGALKLVHKHVAEVPRDLNHPDAGRAVEYSECAICEQPFMRDATS
jgi:hypothetical protein